MDVKAPIIEVLSMYNCDLFSKASGEVVRQATGGGRPTFGS